MKKLMCLCCLVLPLLAYSGEPLMLIKPSRETFINFPSAILPDKAVTVFLPEPAVPLHHKYPVVYILGAVPKDAPAAQQVLDQSARKAILVGVNVDEQDLADPARVTRFFTQELIPYIDTNYPTLDEPAFRAVAAAGAAGAQAASALLARQALFARAVLVTPGTQPSDWANPEKDLRLLLAGPRTEVAAWQALLEEKGLVYGPGFVTQLSAEPLSLFDALQLDYLFAPAEEVNVQKARAQVIATSLSIGQEQPTALTVTAVLANQARFDFIPLSLRISPPYLAWDAATGLLTPVPGAARGKVKISAFVDKVPVKTKITLKK